MRRITHALCGVILFTFAAQAFSAEAQLPCPFQLQAESPHSWDLLDHNAKPNIVATGFGFAEGPVWDDAGFLYASDETLNTIFRVRSDGKKEEVIALGDPDGNTYDRRSRLIDCASVLRAIISVTRDGKYKSWPTIMKARNSTVRMTY
jgi:gluconolactonase